MKVHQAVNVINTATNFMEQTAAREADSGLVDQEIPRVL
jgi:hypothetical protein